jgi:threonine aldolase
MIAAIKPHEYHYPRSRLVALENTHNRGGGLVFDQRAVVAIAEAAQQRGLRVHLDGARIWNASIASGVSEAVLAAPADTVSACFSKGLGAPVGSVIAGPHELAARARRFRKMLGGGMRQSGVLAAAALYALRHQRERLAIDHDNAKRLAAALDALPGVSCPLERVHTNIVMIDLERVSAAQAATAAAAVGVKLGAIAERRLRAVTHLDVSAEDIDLAVERLRTIVG